MIWCSARQCIIDVIHKPTVGETEHDSYIITDAALRNGSWTVVAATNL